MTKIKSTASLDHRVDFESHKQFAIDIFGYGLIAGVVPTYRDLEYLRAHGEFFDGPGLYGREQGVPRECWRNAYDAIWADPSLHYVQGFVLGQSGIIVPHAWCVDTEGNLLELTWDCETAHGDQRYFGVRFTLHQLAGLVSVYGCLDWYEGFSAHLSVD
jgi:hypothetical protein